MLCVLLAVSVGLVGFHRLARPSPHRRAAPRTRPIPYDAVQHGRLFLDCHVEVTNENDDDHYSFYIVASKRQRPRVGDLRSRSLPHPFLRPCLLALAPKTSPPTA
jgi:hypothetical protein